MPDSPVTRTPAWDRTTLRDPHARADKAVRVEAMFDAIAPTYERVNAVASLGRDASWRRRAIAAAEIRPDDVLVDVCCGTGDMLRAVAALPQPPRVILGLDFSAGMLAAGRYEGLRAPVQLVRADGLRLPLRDASVDVITCAFGVRNFQDVPAGLREMRRVLRAGGRAVILEFALPENVLIRWGYRLYCEHILPRVGAWLSRDATGAYRYLPQSIRTFQTRRELVRTLGEAGFAGVTAEALNFGSVLIYVARPERAGAPGA